MHTFGRLQARFGGRPENVAVHIGAVSAIYSRETGAGMGFEIQPYDPAATADPAARPATEPAEAITLADTAVPGPVLGLTEGGRADDAPTPEASDGDTGGDAKRPHLTIVK